MSTLAEQMEELRRAWRSFLGAVVLALEPAVEWLARKLERWEKR